MLSKTESDFITSSEYQSTLGFDVAQPLLKGFTHQAAFAPIRLARLDAGIAFHELRKQLISVLSSVQTAYWDLVLAQGKLQLSADSVQIAQDLLKDAQERVQVGKMSEIDQQEAETQLALRLVEQEDRALDQQEAVTRLQLLIADDRVSRAAGVKAIDPLAPQEWDPSVFSSKSRAMATEAMTLQPELASKRVEEVKAAVRLEYSKDQSLPELNAKAHLGYMGLGDTPEASLQKLNSEEFPTWSLGIELRLPTFGDVKNRGALEQARLGKELATSQRQAAEKEIATSVDALVRRVLVFDRQIDAALAESGFRKQQLDVEIARLDAGKTDIRKVYEMEDALSQARVRELESYNKFRKALVDLGATSGTLLRDQGLEVIQGDLITLSPSILAKSTR